MARTVREEFDRERDFSVARAVTVSGTRFTPGQPFDKLLVNTRRLRQMYQQGLVKQEPFGVVHDFAPAPVVAPVELTPEPVVTEPVEVVGAVESPEPIKATPRVRSRKLRKLQEAE